LKNDDDNDNDNDNDNNNDNDNDEQHVCGQCGVLFDVSYPLGAHDFAMP